MKIRQIIFALPLFLGACDEEPICTPEACEAGEPWLECYHRRPECKEAFALLLCNEACFAFEQSCIATLEAEEASTCQQMRPACDLLCQGFDE